MAGLFSSIAKAFTSVAHKLLPHAPENNASQRAASVSPRKKPSFAHAIARAAAAAAAIVLTAWLAPAPVHASDAFHAAQRAITGAATADSGSLKTSTAPVKTHAVKSAKTKKAIHAKAKRTKHHIKAKKTSRQRKNTAKSSKKSSAPVLTAPVLTMDDYRDAMREALAKTQKTSSMETILKPQPPTAGAYRAPLNLQPQQAVSNPTFELITHATTTIPSNENVAGSRTTLTETLQHNNEDGTALFFGIGAESFTSPHSTSGPQHNTDILAIIAGYEESKTLNQNPPSPDQGKAHGPLYFQDNGLYPALGAINADDANIRVLADSVHEIVTDKRTKNNRASSRPAWLVGVAGKTVFGMESTLPIGAKNDLPASLETFSTFKAGTDEVSASVGIVGVLGDRKNVALPGIPSSSPAEGSGAYLGVKASAIAYDVRTDYAGTEPLQVEGFAGISLALPETRLGKINLDFQAEVPFTTQVARKNATRKDDIYKFPSTCFGFKLRLNF